MTLFAPWTTGRLFHRRPLVGVESSHSVIQYDLPKCPSDPTGCRLSEPRGDAGGRGGVAWLAWIRLPGGHNNTLLERFEGLGRSAQGVLLGQGRVVPGPIPAPWRRDTLLGTSSCWPWEAPLAPLSGGAG